MSKIIWDAEGSHFYETGVKNGVLYPKDNNGAYSSGVAWNGLTAVTEKPSGAEANAKYADDIKYLNLYSVEEFGATIEAYTYPEEFAECDGSKELVSGMSIGQQDRKPFGLSYKTVMGNDDKLDNYGYKLHLVYGAMASPSEKAYATINDSPEAITFSWELNTTPVAVTGGKNTSLVTIDSTKFTAESAAKLKALEAVLYGADEFSASNTYAVGDIVTHTESTVTKLYRCTTAVTSAGAWDASDWTEIATPAGPRLPLPDEVKAILS